MIADMDSNETEKSPLITTQRQAGHTVPCYTGDPLEEHHCTMALESGATEFKTPAFTSKQLRLLTMLAVVSMLCGSINAIMFPFFPTEAASRGISQTLISAVFSCFAASQLLSYPVLGRITPIIGVSRIYTLGLIIAATTTALFGTLECLHSSDVFIAGAFVLRMVEAFGTAAVYTSSFTIIGNQMAERVSTAMSVFIAARSTGLATAPALGGGMYVLGGFQAPFYTVGGLMLLTTLILMKIMPSVKDREKVDSWDYLRRGKRLFTRRESWICLLVTMNHYSAFPGFSSTVAPYIKEAYDVGPAELSLYYMVTAIAYAVVSLVCGRLMEGRHNPYFMMAGCLLTAAAAQLLIPPAPLLPVPPSRWFVAGGMLLQEVAFAGALVPVMPRLVAAAEAAGLPHGVATKSLVSSVFGVAVALGLTTGPLVAGPVVDWLGFPAMMTGVSCVTTLVAVLVFLHAICVSCA